MVGILKLDLKLPYHIQMKQKLNAEDEQVQVEICNWFNDKVEEHNEWINNVWFSDVGHFHLAGYVNSKICVFWGNERMFCSDLGKAQRS